MTRAQLHQMAEQQGIPLRTLNDVRLDLLNAKDNGADQALARIMLRHGRLTEQSRAYVSSHYPQD
jgi:hypothetical protein